MSVVGLVEFAPAHFPMLASWFPSEAEVVQWGGPTVAFPLDRKQFGVMLSGARTDPPERLCWMAQGGSGFIGHAQLGFDWRNGSATLARVAVAPEARGKDLAKPMLRLVLKQAFAHPDIERVELSVYSFNAPAIRTYQALGFIHEGTRRASVRVGAERWDTAVMGLLRKEWQSGKVSP